MENKEDPYNKSWTSLKKVFFFNLKQKKTIFQTGHDVFSYCCQFLKCLECLYNKHYMGSMSAVYMFFDCIKTINNIVTRT